jgi:hypothetical protein
MGEGNGEPEERESLAFGDTAHNERECELRILERVG